MRKLLAGFVALSAAAIVTACADAPTSQAATDAIALHRVRPIGAAQTEGFGRDRLFVFDYTQNFFCPPGAGTGDLPCVVGELPPFPNALDIDPEDEPDLFIIVPFFDADGDGDLEALEVNPAVDVQCPEPGAAFSTCTMHPMTLKAPLGAGGSVIDIPLPNHSHVLRDTPGGSKPWDNFIILVTDQSVWPDRDGNCDAGIGCLTSVEAIRAMDPATQTFGGTGIIPSTLFLFFGVHNLR